MPTKNPAAWSANTAIATFLRLRSSAMDLDPFLAGFEPRDDADVATRHAVVRGEEFDQRGVRLVVDRGRGDAHLEALTVLAGEFRARSARLDVQIEDQIPAAATRRYATGMSTTCRMMNNTAGERSMLAIGGTKRRIGRRKGRTTESNSGASGAYGFTQDRMNCTISANTRM